MREIKFRAWDILCKKFIKIYSLETFTNGSVHMVKIYKKHGEPNRYAFTKDIDGGRIILQQYTGLKDRNGKEIYEGDIVKGYWWENGNKHRHIGRVTYVMNAFKVRGVKQYLGMDDDLNPTYEIIGNIYENPELMDIQVNGTIFL